MPPSKRSSATLPTRADDDDMTGQPSSPQGNCTIETIDDLIAAYEAQVKTYVRAVVILGAAAVAVLVILFVTHFYTQAVTLTGPGMIITAAVPVWMLSASRRERVILLQVQRRRAVRAGSDETELRKVGRHLRPW